MTPASLIAELVARDVTIEVTATGLRCRPATKIQPPEIELIQQWKDAIVKLLQSETAMSAGSNCCLHLDPSKWAYSSDRYQRLGWRTAHCRQCGCFLGYGASDPSSN